MARPPQIPTPPINFKALERAFQEAEAAGARGEVPVGAVLVSATDGAILAASGNRTEALGDPTAHAELMVIRDVAQARLSPRLGDCDLYVTLEPCAMCSAAISFARIRHLVWACGDPKMGGVAHGPQFFSQPTCHHHPILTGPDGMPDGLPERSADLLRDFFRRRRGK